MLYSRANGVQIHFGFIELLDVTWRKNWNLRVKKTVGASLFIAVEGIGQLRAAPMKSVRVWWWLRRGDPFPLSHQGVDRMVSSLSQPQNGKVPQQGCNHGFQMVLNTENCWGTGVSVLRCSLMASSIFLTTESNCVLLSGLSGRASEGSLEMSKSRGGRGRWHHRNTHTLHFHSRHPLLPGRIWESRSGPSTPSHLGNRALLKCILGIHFRTLSIENLFPRHFRQQSPFCTQNYLAIVAFPQLWEQLTTLLQSWTLLFLPYHEGIWK